MWGLSQSVLNWAGSHRGGPGRRSPQSCPWRPLLLENASAWCVESMIGRSPAGVDRGGPWSTPDHRQGPLKESVGCRKRHPRAPAVTTARQNTSAASRCGVVLGGIAGNGVAGVPAHRPPGGRGGPPVPHDSGDDRLGDLGLTARPSEGSPGAAYLEGSHRWTRWRGPVCT